MQESKTGRARAVQIATQQLSWTASEDALKLIFIAGNEPADQDPKADFKEVSDQARRDGIFVVAIFCGQEQDPHAKSWRVMAEWAQGRFATIDHRDGTVVVHTPFDAKLAELSTALNETYLPLGEVGRERTEKLKAQDEKAAKLDSSVAASRAQVKASRLYSSGWDLVDAVEEDKVALTDIAESDLPESLREMSLSDRQSYVDEMLWRRKELRQRIAELSAKRREYVTGQIEAKGLDDSRAFDTVVRQALREKLQEKGFQPSN